MAKINSATIRWRFAAPALAALFFLSSCGNRARSDPKPQPPPPFEFLGAWGTKGDGPGQLDGPVSFAADNLGNVFFADPAAGFVHKFEANGTPLLSFQEASLRRASGIAVDAGGAIYVANAQIGSILVFFPDGSFFQSWHGAAQPHFSGPLGFGIDDEGEIYLPDPAKSRVLKLSNRGHLLKSWAAPQKAASAEERPSWVFAEPGNFVFVAYFSTGRIEKFSSDGSSLAAWPAARAPSGEPGPLSGMAATAEFVLTIAPSSNQIRVWTTDGQHKLDADLGPNVAPIAAPQLAVTPHSELLLFDPSVPRVYRFRMHLESKEPNDTPGH
jgi:hypothetical protein